MTHCARCSAPAEWTLCFGCAGKLRTNIIACRWVWNQLQLNITRQAQTGDPYRDGGKASETPLMFDADASEAGWVIRDALCCWASDVDVPTAGRTLHDIAEDLSGQWIQLARLDDAGQCAEEVDAAKKAGMAVVDRPAVRVFLGDCRCGRRIHADPRDGEFTCIACGATHSVPELRQANRKAGGQVFVTAREAELYLGDVYGVMVTARRIRVWASRKQIRAHEGGVYLVSDILAKLQPATRT